MALAEEEASLMNGFLILTQHIEVLHDTEENYFKIKISFAIYDWTYDHLSNVLWDPECDAYSIGLFMKSNHISVPSFPVSKMWLIICMYVTRMGVD